MFSCTRASAANCLHPNTPATTTSTPINNLFMGRLLLRALSAPVCSPLTLCVIRRFQRPRRIPAARLNSELLRPRPLQSFPHKLFRNAFTPKLRRNPGVGEVDHGLAVSLEQTVLKHRLAVAHG